MKIIEPKKEYVFPSDSSCVTCYDWENSEINAAIVGGEAFWEVYQNHAQYMFRFPIKIIRDPFIADGREACYGGPRYIAIRTDHYPLLWILVWLIQKTKAIADRDFQCVMWWANAIGIADTPRYAYFSWRDFLFVPKIQEEDDF
jgi:hypothetical protein